MHLRVSQNNFCPYCFCIVYAVAMTSHKTGGSLSRFSYTLSKIHHKIFISSKLVNFVLAGGVPSLACSKNINFIGRECLKFEGGWVEL